MSRLRDLAAKASLVLGAAGVVLAGAAMLVLPPAFGRTVVLLATPNSPDVVAANRALWSAGEPVAPIYGTPIGEPMELLFIDANRIITPPEDPSLALYTVDKSKGENPLQAKTVRYFGRIALAGAGLLVLAGALHFAWKRWRRGPTFPTPSGSPPGGPPS